MSQVLISQTPVALLTPSGSIMRRTYERDTKARLSFSGGRHAPANMAGGMEKVYVGGKTQEMVRLRRRTTLHLVRQIFVNP